MGVVPYVALYLAPAAIASALIVYGWRQRRQRGAGPFSLLMAALAFWSACHALSVGSSTLAGTLFWSKVQYAGIVTISPLFLLFALAYAGRWGWVTRPRLALLFLPGIIAYALVLTNDWHHLWWTRVAIDSSRPFGSLAIERGLLFWLHATIAYGYILVALGLFIRSLTESSPPYHHQARMMVVGALIPLVGNIVHLMGVRTAAVDDPTPFLFLATGLTTAYATMRYRLLDLTPIAEHEIFERMPDGVVVLDRRGCVVTLNHSAPRLLATPARSWPGHMFLSAAAGSPIAHDLAELLAAPDAVNVRRTTFLRDGELYGVEIRIRPLLDERGSTAGTLIVLRDTTERTRMEQVITQQLAELTFVSRIARAVNTAVQTGDVVRAITREVLASLKWERVILALLQPDEVTLRLVIDEQADAEPQLEGLAAAVVHFQPLLDILNGGKARVLDTGDPSLASTPLEAAIRQLGLRTVLAVPLHNRGRPLGLLFMGRTTALELAASDIHLAETIGELVTDAAVRAHLYEEVQQASKLKSAFLATVSHELRTPLTSIIGYVDMLRRGLYGALPEPMVEPLTYARHSSEHLLRLINDILDFAKMEAGRFAVDLYPVDLEMVVQNVASAMRPQMTQRGLELRVELEPDLPRVQGNSIRIEQVLTNLVANAVKFTDQGTVTVRAGLYGDRVRLSVVDTGVGIAPEQQEAVFREFQQVEGPHTRRFGGTGLGLAISRRLVELMGGTMALESALGAGASFHCDLLIAVVSPPQAAAYQMGEA